MAQTAQEYPITFPYGAITPPYSEDRPHKGNDRKMPTGTPVVIGDTVVGLAGNTGLSSGSHLHTQAGTDQATSKTVNPTPYEFKPGVVINLRTTDTGEWGRFVTIRTESGMNITYAHLSKVNVTLGQVIKGDDMDCKPDAKTVTEYFVRWVGRTPTVAELADYTSKDWRYLADKLLKNEENEKKAVQLQFDKYKAENPPLSGYVPYTGAKLFVEKKPM